MAICEVLSRPFPKKFPKGVHFLALFGKSTFFPPLLADDIIAIGEKIGNLGGALERAASRYDRELSTKTQHLTTLIQPLTILIVALFVGIVAYSMIAGILSSISGLKVY